MAHTIEPAASGRSKCRGCGIAIAKGELRFGERLPNPFADGEMTLWFHVRCAACKRPESLLELLQNPEDGDVNADMDTDTGERDELRAVADFSMAHPRLARLNGVERAPSGRARCRACHALIAKDEWRIPLVFFEEGMFNPSGFIHVACAPEYFETPEIIDRLRQFGGELESTDVAELQALLVGGG